MARASPPCLAARLMLSACSKNLTRSLKRLHVQTGVKKVALVTTMVTDLTVTLPLAVPAVPSAAGYQRLLLTVWLMQDICPQGFIQSTRVQGKCTSAPRHVVCGIQCTAAVCPVWSRVPVSQSRRPLRPLLMQDAAELLCLSLPGHPLHHGS